MNDAIRIVEADLSLEQHRRDVVAMTAAYALDPMGNAGPLAPEVLARLGEALRRHPTTIVFLAYDGDRAIGIATSFLGFSTFYAAPLVNLHDLSVIAAYRGRGIARRLLHAVETKARELGCCKLTLEVSENNARARRLYESEGFAPALYGEGAGPTFFFAKVL